MWRKPGFWIVLSLLSLGGVLFTFKYFSAAFPIVTLDLRMDRETALRSARELAQKHNWGPAGFRQAASFGLDSDVQNFVELEAGGNEAFSRMLSEGLYSPYTWEVRHFKEGETTETHVRFTPQGEPYGFAQKLPENEPGASLTSEAARVVAETAAQGAWQIDLAAYELVEASQEIRPGGRADHTFVYERPNVRIGDGRYRLRLVVGGDRLTELTHFIKIPEAFSRRYEQMRSANDTIATVSLIAMAVVYGLGGCLIGLFFLLRQRWVLWRQPLFWGLFVASLQVLASISQWPLDWMEYDTALSLRGFMLQQILQLLLIFFGETVLLALTFMAAESLTRKAFPQHIQLWRLWSPDVAGSRSVLGRTVGGFLIVGFDFAFVVAIYFFSTKVLGWWTPSSALFEPDVLATYFPWLSSVAISLHAGFWEECLFRAVPIAGAALIGQRFGHRRAWIMGGFILQALIFGAGHANYPTQPAYARLVELIIPSFVFGGLYLLFGLLPAIISHFVFDVVWFALPLFVSSAPGIWIDQSLVILLTLVPLWIVLYARWRSGAWSEIKEEHYNRSWQPPAKEEPEPVVAEAREAVALGSKTRLGLLAGGILGLAVWIFVTDFQPDAPPLTIGRNQAKELARKTLTERGVELSDAWRVLSTVDGSPDQDDRFVWQEGDQQAYETLLGSYLAPPHWMIRFARFEGDVAERAEEYQVFIAGDGQVVRVRHQLPEARPGASLTREEARTIARSVVKSNYRLDPYALKEVSAEPAKLPARQDWTFTFADSEHYPLKEGEARIAVEMAGDQVVDTYRYVHVPEAWARQERNQRNVIDIVRTFCGAVLIALMLAGIVGAMVRWGRKKFSIRIFLSCFALLLGLRIISLVNGWPEAIAGFSTAEPLTNQTLAEIGGSLVGTLFVSIGFALLVGFVQSWRSQQARMESFQAVGLGISLGSLAAGLLSLTALFAPSLAPVWAEYDAVGSYLPVLSAGLDPVEQYVMLTALALFLFTAVDRFTHGWTQRRGLFSIGLILLGLVVTGVTTDSLLFWVPSGLLMGVVLLLVYQLVFRFHVALIPLAMVAVAILGTLRQGLLRAYPTAMSGAAVAIVLTGLLAFYWYRQLAAGPTVETVLPGQEAVSEESAGE